MDHNSEYQIFSNNLQENFKKHQNKVMFITDVNDLWSMYLNNLPSQYRQHYNCSACRHFINHYGSLVVINDNGKQESVLWEDNTVFFKEAVKALKTAVESAKVISVFHTKNNTLGTPTTMKPIVWHHLGVGNTRIWNSNLITPNQAMSNSIQEFEMLSRSLNELPKDVVEIAVALLRSETLYRSDRFLGIAEKFLKLHEDIQKTKNTKLKENLIWYTLSTAPAGFAHIKGTVIGTLLEDIMSGASLETVKLSFQNKVNPNNYQRATVAPNIQLVQKANKIVEALKAEGSLSRRYLLKDELVPVWQDLTLKGILARGGIFGNIPVKDKTNNNDKGIELPGKLITWEKFSKTVLPNASKLEVFVPKNANNYVGLVTAENKESTPILQWDILEARNPVSWYYSSGIDAELKQRVIEAGGQYENVDIRATLMWNNRNDLDLHVITPANEEIYYGHKRDISGGYLDIDRNVNGETITPVENTRWATGKARQGMYTVFIQNFRFHDSRFDPTPYYVEVEVNGTVLKYVGVMPANVTGSNSNQVVIKFMYEYGKAFQIKQSIQEHTNEAWSETNAFVKCYAISNSPNMWATKVPHSGEHVFFLLENCKDTSDSGRGIITETLKTEFHEIRSVLESYYSMEKILPNNKNEQVAGLGFSKGREWNVYVRVFDNIGIATYYKIDRFE